MKRLVFLTGTRADFGKMKSLITAASNSGDFEVFLFVTGMHLLPKYGYTIDEIKKCGFKNIEAYSNHTSEQSMDKTLAKTIVGFSNFVSSISPDLIVLHGDRIEALAGATVGALNNILVAHIEGGEISGTVDELIRHAVTKMSHIHFAGNKEACIRLKQLGELPQNIYNIGSPDVDIMLSKLPALPKVLSHYEVPFKKYALVLFHPITTEIKNIKEYSKNLVQSLLESKLDYIVVFPNNDNGSAHILKAYKELENKSNIKIFPSIRFEYFLVLLKNAQFIIGNSSAGIREAPYYGIPTINIGTRQNKRTMNTDIINCDYQSNSISNSINKAIKTKNKKKELFGKGNSAELFIKTISKSTFWETSKQKHFNDIPTR